MKETLPSYEAMMPVVLKVLADGVSRPLREVFELVCQHYAFMGLEVCGLAEKNFSDIYIDSHEYSEELRRAVLLLSRRGLHPSVYNVPLCSCHPEIHSFARRSISAWKNSFEESCAACSKSEDCCGFFATSTKKIAHTPNPFID